MSELVELERWECVSCARRVPVWLDWWHRWRCGGPVELVVYVRADQVGQWLGEVADENTAPRHRLTMVMTDPPE